MSQPNITRGSFRSAVSARPETDTSLPRVLHMTWLGSPLPPKFAPNILSYVSLNPDHELWLWLDTSPDNVNIGHKQIRVRDVNKETWTTRDMLDRSTNFAMKSDILRLEILYKYGGIYVDIDSMALRSFGKSLLIKNYDLDKLFSRSSFPSCLSVI